jgi:hypothetical protein
MNLPARMAVMGSGAAGVAGAAGAAGVAGVAGADVAKHTGATRDKQSIAILVFLRTNVL